MADTNYGDVSAIKAKSAILVNNKLARMSYTSSAYANDDAAGVDLYDVNHAQNIPSQSATDVNDTVLDKGLRSKATSLPRNFINHFYGRSSYNLNKLTDWFDSVLAILLRHFAQNRNLYSPSTEYQIGDVCSMLVTDSGVTVVKEFIRITDNPVKLTGTPPLDAVGTLSSHWALSKAIDTVTQEQTVKNTKVASTKYVADAIDAYAKSSPISVTTNYATGSVQEPTAWLILAGCTSFTLGDGSFAGLRIKLINTTQYYVQLVTGQESGWILPYQTLDVMWLGDCWYVCDGHMVGEIINVTFPLAKIPFGYLTLHSGIRPSRTAYKRLANTILYPLTNVPFTVTTATPAIFTVAAGHGFTGGERLRLFTSGALTGATLGQDYFVEYISATTFYLLTLEGGTTRLAITAQSGTHYYQCSAYGVGDGSTTMDLPDPRQSAFVGAGTGTTHNIASVDSYLRGQFKDDQMQTLVGSISAANRSGFTSASGVFKLSGSQQRSAEGADAYPGTVTLNSAYTNRSGDVTRTKQIGANYLIKY